jgi:hypothetical protein
MVTGQRKMKNRQRGMLDLIVTIHLSPVQLLLFLIFVVTSNYASITSYAFVGVEYECVFVHCLTIYRFC